MKSPELTKPTRAEVLTISKPEQLYKLLNQFRLISIRNQYIELKLPHLTDHQNNYYGEKINKLYNTCGCKEGALGGASALILGAAISFFEKVIFNTWPLGSLLLAGVFLIFAGITLGKFFGIARAKFRLRSWIRKTSVTQ